MPQSTRRSRFEAALVGLAIGDALGAAVEFRSPGTFPPVTNYRDGGPWHLNPGEWTDDTSKALGLADGLIEGEGYVVPKLIIERWRSWHLGNQYSAKDRCFDMGGQTASGLARAYRIIDNWQPYTLEEARRTSTSNGGIMGMSPAVIANHHSEFAAVQAALIQTGITHPNPEVMSASELMARLIWQMAHTGSITPLLKHHIKPKSAVHGASDARGALDAAMWGVASTSTFSDAVLAVVNLGGDADTTGAIAGQLAGALYGLENIPAHWRTNLFRTEQVHTTAAKLYALRSEPALAHPAQVELAA